MKCGILNDNYNDYMTCMFNGKFALDKAWLFQVLNNLVGPWKDDGKKQFYLVWGFYYKNWKKLYIKLDVKI